MPIVIMVLTLPKNMQRKESKLLLMMLLDLEEVKHKNKLEDTFKIYKF